MVETRGQDGRAVGCASGILAQTVTIGTALLSISVAADITFTRRRDWVEEIGGSALLYAGLWQHSPV